MSSSSSAKLLVASSKGNVPSVLCPPIVEMAKAALQDHGAVSIALSGGSLPTFLAQLASAFELPDESPPQWDKWHVFLADERCVHEDHEDSNTKALMDKFLSHVPIPESQIYKINQEYVASSSLEGRDGSSDSAAIAKDYQTKLITVLEQNTKGRLDIAVLGFGPDGHTCSLFPGHKLVAPDQQSSNIWVAPIDDSPKPPPQRITLTLPVLTEKTDHIILCGAGGSKQPIVSKVFSALSKKTDKDNDGTLEYEATMAQPPPYPCAMVRPTKSLIWVLDKDALGGC